MKAKSTNTAEMWSAERIKELTMKKINGEAAETPARAKAPRRGIKRSAAVVLAAVLALSLMTAALAATNSFGARVAPSPSPSPVEPSPTEPPTPVIDKITVKVPGCDAAFTLENVCAVYQSTYFEEGNTTSYNFFFLDDKGKVSCDSAAWTSYNAAWPYWDKTVDMPYVRYESYDGPWSVGYPEEWRGAASWRLGTYGVVMTEDGITDYWNSAYLGGISFMFMQGLGDVIGGENLHPIEELAVG
ncbi:MAG: hypothetical protein LBS90_00150 [Oscillospiraceae bacterium]|jgi:hypothetical protein|nr:hypothetical protein [Oscillospiraceae bacterium]